MKRQTKEVTSQKVLESNKQLAQLEDGIRLTTKVVKKDDRTVGLKTDVDKAQKIADEVANTSQKNIEELQAIKMA